MESKYFDFNNGNFYFKNNFPNWLSSAIKNICGDSYDLNSNWSARICILFILALEDRASSPLGMNAFVMQKFIVANNDKKLEKLYEWAYHNVDHDLFGESFKDTISLYSSKWSDSNINMHQFLMSTQYNAIKSICIDLYNAWNAKSTDSYDNFILSAIDTYKHTFTIGVFKGKDIELAKSQWANDNKNSKIMCFIYSRLGNDGRVKDPKITGNYMVDYGY